MPASTLPPRPLRSGLPLPAALLAGLLMLAPSARAEPEHRMAVSAGLGVSFPYADDRFDDDADANGLGFFAEAVYLYRHVEWATPRAYAGVALTRTNGDCEYARCKVDANIFFAGIKGRLLAPIPYVAPFLELGIGASLGSMHTQIGSAVDYATSGAMYHVPLALGLALGADHSVELAFQYLFHPEQWQAVGALAVGLEFPLD